MGYSPLILAFFRAVFVLSVLTACPAGLAASLSESEMRKALVQANKQLPVIVDQETKTRLDNISLSGKTVSYNYTVMTLETTVSLPAWVIDNEKRELIAKTCADPGMRKMYLETGYSVVHVYRCRDGSVFSSTLVSPSDCNKSRK